MPKGSERLRITPSPYHDDVLIDQLAEALVQVWERLDAIRNYVAVRGGSVADYDKRRAVSLATADRYDIITLKNYKGQDTRNVGTATFEPGNQDLAINAIRAIRAALDALG